MKVDIMQEAREATEGRFVLRLRAWESDKRTAWMAEELEKTRRERDEALAQLVALREAADAYRTATDNGARTAESDRLDDALAEGEK